LYKGQAVTAAQAEKRFGIKNIAAEASRIRSNGYAVYTNQTKNGKTAYRLGTPSRKMVAAAYAMFGGDAFSRA
jgi:hypothetical protein